MSIVNSYLLPNAGASAQGILVLQTDQGVVSGTNVLDGSVVDAATLTYWINLTNSSVAASPSPILVQTDLLTDFTIPETQ